MQNTSALPLPRSCSRLARYLRRVIPRHPNCRWGRWWGGGVAVVAVWRVLSAMTTCLGASSVSSPTMGRMWSGLYLYFSVRSVTNI